MDSGHLQATRDPVLCTNAEIGARNLLVNAAGIRAGHELLIVNVDDGSVDPAVPETITRIARTMGARVHVLWTADVAAPAEVPPSVRAAFEAADVTIFNHRMGNMLRMMPLAAGTYVSNFMTTLPLLASPVARTPMRYWMRVLAALHARLATAQRWRITCPAGTDIAGEVAADAGERRAGPAAQAFTMVAFPVGVFRPFSTLESSGRIAMRWFTSSGIHAYDAGHSLAAPVVVTVERGRLAGFDGEAADVAAMKAYLGRVAARFGKEPMIVNSWHAGLNAQMIPAATIAVDVDEWMRIAHCNPRVLHFHVIGEAVPGELSVPIVDPTITIDDEILWDRGRFAFADDPKLVAELALLGDPAIAAGRPAEIGVA